jgi:hypothetical protein
MPGDLGEGPRAGDLGEVPVPRTLGEVLVRERPWGNGRGDRCGRSPTWEEGTG